MRNEEWRMESGEWRVENYSHSGGQMFRYAQHDREGTAERREERSLLLCQRKIVFRAGRLITLLPQGY